jgi:2-amino-4-hydroxy-6-hydroxymethyldihydropteridine diphosphokinase
VTVAGMAGRTDGRTERGRDGGTEGQGNGAWVRAFVGIGSNLGERAANLAAAVERLDGRPGVRVVRRAGLYESAPVGVTDQPWFLNTVVEIETSLRPRELLRAQKAIEHELGRRSSRRWGERLIDLDLLLYDELRVDEADLVIPHPELWRRLFVLAPLLELRPDLISPDGRSIADAARTLRDSQAVRPLAVSAG